VLCGRSWAPVFDQDNRGAAYQFPHDPTISPIAADWSVMVCSVYTLLWLRYLFVFLQNSHIVQDAASFPTAFVSPIMTAGLELGLFFILDFNHLFLFAHYAIVVSRFLNL
jgi:hypothetical protein